MAKRKSAFDEADSQRRWRESVSVYPRGSNEQTTDEGNDTIAVQSPRFQLGKVVATPGAIEALSAAQTSAWELLSKHVICDFGDVDATDWQSNLDAIKDGERVLSAYTLKTGERLWAITEADRSSTCLLRPDEY